MTYEYYEQLPNMAEQIEYDRQHEDNPLTLVKWEYPENIAQNYGINVKAGRKPDPHRIILGRVDHHLISVQDNMHMMTIAGTRSGKTVNVKNNLFFHRASVLAVDVKSELARDTAIIRHENLGQDIFIIDPEGLVQNNAKRFRAYFNPMQHMTIDNPKTIEYAAKLADSLVVRHAGVKDPFWDNSAHTFIEGVIMHVCTCPKYKRNRNLPQVYRLVAVGAEFETVDDEGNPETLTGLKGLVAEMEDNSRKLEGRGHRFAQKGYDQIAENCIDLAFLIYASAMDIGERSDKERSGVVSTARQHLSFIRYRSMENILKAGKYERTFNLADLKENQNGMTVYLCLPPSKLARCSGWLRMFLGLSIIEMEHAKAQMPPDWKIGQPETATGLQTLFILDEFATAIGRMEELKNAAGLVAGSPYDIRLWCIVQDLSQLKALYQDSWETFLGNCGTITCFCNSDLTTTEFIAKKIGKFVSEKTSLRPVSASEANQGKKEDGAGRQLIEGILPQEISVFFGREDVHDRIVVFSAGNLPWAIQRADFYDAKSPVYAAFRQCNEVVKANYEARAKG